MKNRLTPLSDRDRELIEKSMETGEGRAKLSKSLPNWVGVIADTGIEHLENAGVKIEKADKNKIPTTAKLTSILNDISKTVSLLQLLDEVGTLITKKTKKK